MHTDRACMALLDHILPRIDPDRNGWCIDVGVGTYSYYCERFARLNFPTAAVEPLVTDQLRALCQRLDIRMFEGVLSDHDGPAVLYPGKTDPNHSSIWADWWAAGSEPIDVPSITLAGLLSDVGAGALTCLKLDVEGAEWLILKQLEGIEANLVPQVVMFEYGGCIPERGIIGWAGRFYEGTINSLRLMQRLEFTTGVVIDDSHGSHPHLFDFQSSDFDPEAIFPPVVVYGNIIAVRDLALPAQTVKAITDRYYESWFQRRLRRGLLRLGFRR